MKINHIMTGVLLCNFLVALEGIKILNFYWNTGPGLPSILLSSYLPALIWLIPTIMAFTMRSGRFIAVILAACIILVPKSFALISAPKNVYVQPFWHFLDGDILLLIAVVACVPFAYFEAKQCNRQ